MSEQRFRLRIRYAKAGRLRYLSHLETMRCLERSIRRADLPFLVTQGFSPHMRTSFGWALPVGVSSQCEYIDVLVGEFVEPANVMEALAAAMPPDMPVKDAYYVDPAARALEEEFPFSVYVCELAAAPGSAAESDVLACAQTALDAVLARGNMVVHRKKKDKVVEFDKLLMGTPELCASSAGACKMRLATFTEGKGSLRPDLFCAEVVAASGGELSVRSSERTLQSSERP